MHKPLRSFLQAGPSKQHVQIVKETLQRQRRLHNRASSVLAAPASTAPRSRPSFPCVDAHAARESRILQTTAARSTRSPSDPCSTGPEPIYTRPKPSEYHLYKHERPFPLIYTSESLSSFELAYETWGTLSPSKDNVILLHTGLSASSHAASTELNPTEGWWEKFIGPGKALDTNQFFIICVNVLGGCYGSTGPSSIDPRTGTHYGTHFPVISVFDMVRAQFELLDHLGIKKLYASVGSSMGGMQSLAAGWLHPERVEKVVSISGTARTSPGSVAMRFAQRSGQYYPNSHKLLAITYILFHSVLMSDPNWNNGFYYDGLPPHVGMKLARRKSQ